MSVGALSNLSQAFKPESYVAPRDEAELSRLLKEHGERARIIAGGTGIYEIAHRGLLSELEVLVDIRKLGLSYVVREGTNKKIRVGAATTMTTIAKSEDVRREKSLCAIADALKLIQPLQVKNVATAAGAVCTALPFFDLPVALLSCGASVIIGPGGRSEDLSHFIRGYFSVGLDEGEFVREVEIPLGKANTASAFQKFALTHDDWALINCGVSATLGEGESRKIEDVVVVFGGGVGEKPVRATGVEKALVGLRASDESRIKDLFEKIVPKDVEPISDIRSSSEYRTHLAKVLGRRTLLQAAGRV